MHAQLECLLNAGSVASWALEVTKFLALVSAGAFCGLEAFRTEWTVYMLMRRMWSDPLISWHDREQTTHGCSSIGSVLAVSVIKTKPLAVTMYIVSLRPDNDTFVDLVPVMTAEATDLLTGHRDII